MGGHPIENIKQIVDSIFLAIENENETLEETIARLENYPIEKLSPQELRFLSKAIEEIEKRLEAKRSNVVQALRQKEDLKKYRF